MLLLKTTDIFWRRYVLTFHLLRYIHEFDLTISDFCDDHILLFFLSMAEEVRKLPSSTRLRVQSQISSLIADAIDQI